MEFVLTYNLHRSTFSASRRERIVSLHEKCKNELIREAKAIINLVHGKDQCVTLLSIKRYHPQTTREPLLLSIDGVIQTNMAS